MPGSYIGAHLPLLFLILVSFFWVDLVSANNIRANAQLLDLPIEELMKVQVTTASRHSQKLAEIPAAVFVITQDDIRRSGATSIPEALRMAPGVEVARIGTDKWAINIRGFNGRFADKLQVLIDGRSVYNPLFSGVQWEQLDTFMEDIERIEVIRGPGAALWGANAVNGVINIITKKARDTQGTLFTAGGGSFERGFVGARHGGKINEDTAYRVYAKGFARDNMEAIQGKNANDNWHSARGGFRLDHQRGNDHFTLQGDIFYNSFGDTLSKSSFDITNSQIDSARGHNEGGNIRFRWDRTISEKSAIMFQAYYDRVDYKSLISNQFKAESFDIDINHRFPLFNRHDVTWGLNYRLYHNKIYDGALLSFIPRDRINQLFSGYIRDEITLIPERLKLTLGTRLDHNDFTGLEVQPNGRLMWTPNEKNSIWLAISRAVRTPSRAENDILFNYGTQGKPPFLTVLQLNGSSHFNSEKLLAYEAGYRHQLAPQASIDIAAFYNDYSQLRDLTFDPRLGSFHAGIPSYFLLPIGLNNKASGQTQGVEVSVDWQPHEKWRLQGNYSFLTMQIHSESPFRSLDPTTGSADKTTPQHNMSFRSHYDLSEKLQFNLWMRYVSNISFYNIPDYVTMDAKLIFKPTKNVELFLVGQNLFQEKHKEFVSDFIPSLPTYIPRGIYAGAQWRF